MYVVEYGTIWYNTGPGFGLKGSCHEAVLRWNVTVIRRHWGILCNFSRGWLPEFNFRVRSDSRYRASRFERLDEGLGFRGLGFRV